MKPRSVSFSAFGSYPDATTVDFDQLAARGLFVVSGDTGTGKTTIFDAMTFALFGDVPGKDARYLRSHHAAPDTATEVSFTFDVGGVTYTAHRSPTYERPAKRGGGTTTQNATALLERHETDGTTTALATRAREMRQRVEELIGLSVEQFQRVMVLPQGEVTRFLTDSSADRETLLSNLFGGDVYERVTTALEAESSQLGTQVEKVDEELRHHLLNAQKNLVQLLERLEQPAPEEPEYLDADEISQHADTAAPIIEQLKIDAAEAAEAARLAEQQHTVGQAAAQRFADAERLRAELRQLDLDEPSVRTAAAAAEHSRLARPVVTAAADADSAEQARALAARQVSDTTDEIVRVAADSGIDLPSHTGAAVSAAVEGARRSVGTDRVLLEELATSIAALTAATDKRATVDEQLTTARAHTTAAEAELAELSDLLDGLGPPPDDLAKIEPELERLTNALDSAGQRDNALVAASTASDAAAEAQRTYEGVLLDFIETQAPRLAVQLSHGDPCPVCGSAEHPHPATGAGQAVSIDDLSKAQRNAAEAADTSRATDARVSNIRGALGDLADIAVEDIAARLEDLQALAATVRSHAAAVADLTAKVQGAGTRQKALAATVSDLAVNQATLDGQISTLTERENTARTAAAHVDPERLQAVEAALGVLSPLVQALPQLEAVASSAHGEAVSGRRAANSALANSAFETAEDATAALIDPDTEARAIAALDTLKADRARATGALGELERQGIPDQAPDVDALIAAATQASEAAGQAAARFTTATTSAEEIQRALADYRRIGQESAEVRRRAAVARHAHEVCRGRGRIRISLRRWVLGLELERVTAAASEHLRAMTSGRYTLRRTTEHLGGNATRGLDIDVLDAFTGRPRSPASLSGGEQFQASLALALGLADVVSRGGSAGGHRLEALFIDEGFGSLDAQALDDAIETLHMLQSTGRLVGAITHVAAMKERLHAGIVVRRLPDGRGSTLTVHP